jgi:coproporphyrinogen III oxidase-like Fe-S oxidoreductase/pyruvate-formate lyase-activating enzyme
MAIERIDPGLPLFRLARRGCNAFYAPGHVARTSSNALRRCAEEAQVAWQSLAEAPFAPVCLTLYLNNRCNLACGYCYAAAGREQASPPIAERGALGAARLVARCCAERNKPFDLVLHGGGEPTRDWESVTRLVDGTRAIAAQADVGWQGFLATNGVMPEERAAWLGRELDLVEISCDGPPDIQDRQRPLAGGGPTSPHVVRTARALREACGRLLVRATITPETVERQTEIVAYLHEALGATEMRFEPVYRAAAFAPEQAEWFVRHFLQAQREARARGCGLAISGARLDEIHGPFCDVLRDVLHLLPDGTATACFFCTNGSAANAAGMAIGKWDDSRGEYTLDAERIAAHRRKALELPAACRECINVCHCARECPERCAVTDGEPETPSFRCLVQRRLAEEWLLEAVSTPYPLGQRSLPPPVWAERGYDEKGAEAWRRLSATLSNSGGRGPISVYAHVPFCDRRCPFCDCHSVALAPPGLPKQEEFAAALVAEIQAWSRLGNLASRPVTTVHFGGGTPSFLSHPVFARILEACRAHLAVTPQTEWAIESNSSPLNDEYLEQLREWGFTRLHVGVQTLEDPVRRTIGRREPGQTALEKVSQALDRGFVVSVDVVYGLPGQTQGGLLKDLERLVASGVDGFSLYQLQISDRNRRFLERQGINAQDAARDYALFQEADRYLSAHGYRKNHFVHYARPRDRNLYYTHMVRGEDLLALGPSADGVFGAYHYRHPEYGEYATGGEVPVLEGGVLENALEQRVRPLVVGLMAGSLPAAGSERFIGAGLTDQWLEWGLIERNGDALSLTASGSWFLGEMLMQVKTNET